MNETLQKMMENLLASSQVLNDDGWKSLQAFYDSHLAAVSGKTKPDPQEPASNDQPQSPGDIRE